jgi:hypothetical protein
VLQRAHQCGNLLIVVACRRDVIDLRLTSGSNVFLRKGFDMALNLSGTGRHAEAVAFAKTEREDTAAEIIRNNAELRQQASELLLEISVLREKILQPK